MSKTKAFQTVSMTEEQKEQLQKYCTRHNIGISEKIREVLIEKRIIKREKK